MIQIVRHEMAETPLVLLGARCKELTQDLGLNCHAEDNVYTC